MIASALLQSVSRHRTSGCFGVAAARSYRRPSRSDQRHPRCSSRSRCASPHQVSGRHTRQPSPVEVEPGSAGQHFMQQPRPSSHLVTAGSYPLGLLSRFTPGVVSIAVRPGSLDVRRPGHHRGTPTTPPGGARDGPRSSADHVELSPTCRRYLYRARPGLAPEPLIPTRRVVHQLNVQPGFCASHREIALEGLLQRPHPVPSTAGTK